MYVIDTSSLQQLFRCYSQERFPTLWQRFDELVAYGTITSIRQVMREIEQRNKKDGEVEWVAERTKTCFRVQQSKSYIS